MGKFSLNETFIYKHRFILGYGLFAISLITVLLISCLYYPGGISEQEIRAVITSGNIDFNNIDSLAIANLPYHLLQKASLSIFNANLLAIKLPSAILAFFSAVGIVLLLRRWFKPSIGVLASLIAVSTSRFIFFAQDGTPGIMYIFWAVWLILLASLIVSQVKHRLLYIIAFYATAFLSLYTPLSLYVILAIIFSVLFHPHLRYTVKNLPKSKLIIGIIMAILLSLPLILLVANQPKLISELLGIPSVIPNISDNLKTLWSHYFSFTKASESILMTPFYELSSMLMVFIGVSIVYKERFTSKNYLIIFWIVCIIPIIIINPSFTSVTFLPILLLLASGLNFILSYWYKLFPRNPYARIGGLIPLTVLISVLVLSGLDRHIYSYTYEPKLASSFSRDLNIVNDGPKYLVVSQAEKPFFEVITKYNKSIIISTKPTTDYFWATRQAKKNYTGYKIDHIITSSFKDNSDRFYLYKKTAN